MDWTPLVTALPQGGSIVAFIVVVVLFLNYLKESNVTHRGCEERLENMTERCITVITDNTEAMVGLKEAVKELKTRV